jgi:hypothetical protein
MCVNDAKISPVLNKTKDAIALIDKSRHVTSRHSHMHDVVKYWGKKISLSVPPLVRRVKDSHTSGRCKCMTSLSRACNCWVGTHHIIQNTSQLALETDYVLINNEGYHSRRGSYMTQFAHHTTFFFRFFFWNKSLLKENCLKVLYSLTDALIY